MAVNQMAVLKKEIVDVVEERISQYQKDAAIHFPPNYSPQNALKSAWLILQETKDKDKRPVLSVCTKDSICNALLNTVIQGLSPAKKQIYYIAHGNILTAMRSYHGTLAMTKRINGVEGVSAEIIYGGDEFEMQIEHGVKKVIKHAQQFQNIDDRNIIGAYCTIIHNGGQEYTEVMTKAQIAASWAKRSNKGDVQQDFPAEMSKRTVINRACKRFVNSSDDSDLMIQAFNETGELPSVEVVAQKEIAANANKELLDIPVDYEIDGEVISSDAETTTEPPETTTNTAETATSNKELEQDDPGY